MFRNRLSWQWVLKDEPRDKPRFHVKLPTPRCGRKVEPSLAAWMNRYHSAVLEGVGRARRRLRLGSGHFMRRTSNMLPITKLGFKLLSTSEFIAVPNDKSPGYAIRSIADHKLVVAEIFASPRYYAVVKNSVNENLIMESVSKIALKLGKELDDPRLCGQICRSFRLKGATIFSQLLLLCKTHKPHGQVTHRAVHSSPAYLLMGLSKWFSVMCADRLASLSVPHLVRSSRDAVTRLLATPCPPGGLHFVCLDVKDFYLVGSPDQLTDAVLSGWWSSSLESCLRALLTYQYVDSQWLEDRSEVFQVMEGFGQGLPHSSECADLAFYNIVEKGILSSARMFGILNYVRFRDDVIVAVANSQRMTGCLAFFKRYIPLGRWWKITADRVGSSVPYLDFRISYSCGRIRTVPYEKPTSAGALPLCGSSAHHPSVHASWPRATLLNKFSVASSRECFADVYRTFVDKFCSNFVSLPLLPSPYPHTVDERVMNLVRREFTVWLPLPFHPLIYRDVNAAIRKLNEDCLVNSFYSVAFNTFGRPIVKVAWRNCLLSHEFRVRKCSTLALRAEGWA